MTSRTTKVVVATPTFQSAILIATGNHLKKLLKPEEIILRSVTGETDSQREHLRRLLTQIELTALIAMDIRPDPDIIAAYTEAGVPIILIDEEADGVSTITIDNHLGGFIAGDYLVKNGKKKIAIVTGRTGVKGGYNAEQRLKGFQLALGEKGLSIPAGCAIEVNHYSREDGLEVMPQLIEAGVDAIFCAAGDNCELGLLNVAKDKGKKIPEEIAIIGFDDLLIAQMSIPPLTTIRQPLDKMAEAAYKMAVLHRNEILKKSQKVIFNPELVIRQSA